jgi:hypothetical protein
MKKSMILNHTGLLFVRYWAVAYIFLMKKEEDEGEIFTAIPPINAILDFMLFLMKKCNPRVGFADVVLKGLFEIYSGAVNTGFEFAEFASRPYKEKILSRCVNLGFISHTEKMLVLLGRQITEKELEQLFKKNLGSSDGCESVIALTKKHYPHMVAEFEQRKASYDREDDVGAC